MTNGPRRLNPSSFSTDWLPRSGLTMMGPMELELKITGRTIKRVAWVVAAVAAVVGGAVLAMTLFGRESPLESFVDEDALQAVFLSDGRAYIGDLVSDRGDYYVLRNVFYLQQAPNAEGKEGQQTQQVLPRSGDLHGPQGRMLIPKGAVILIENLRSNAELSETIDRLRRQNGGR